MQGKRIFHELAFINPELFQIRFDLSSGIFIKKALDFQLHTISWIYLLKAQEQYFDYFRSRATEPEIIIHNTNGTS